MAKTKKKTFRWQAHKPLLATALAVAGVFNMVGAVLADGTAAGTDISNTATATYNDGNGNNFDATSNTVVIRVAEIAGLTVVASPVEDGDGGAIEAGDDLTFIFTVTNVGNAETDVFIPDITGFRTDNFTPSATDPVQVFEADGTTLIGTGIVTAGGITITGLGGAPIQPDASFVVKVTGTPEGGLDPAVAGDSVSVTLGNTDDNPTVEGVDQTQNQSDNDDGATNTDDLRTVNAPPNAANGGITDGLPENGEREAQATASGIFASSVRPLALATVLKTSSVVNSGTPADPTDDLITYDLGLRVEDTSPSALFQAAALEGTDIVTVDGATVKRILVSDAIPAGTVLDSVSTTLPTGWTAVYTTDTGNDPLALTWVTVPPAGTVTRVGFVFDGTIGATGTTLTGLEFTVVTSGVPAAGGTVENIAQVFGQTVGDPDDTDGDPLTVPQVIYDESGDANPNNFDGTTLPDAGGDETGSEYTPGTDTGIANAAAQGTDTNNNNGGAGEDGEVNVVTLTPTTDDILNGTDGVPEAVGPVGDNDDFTNKSTPTPAAGTDPTAPFDPDPVTFNNSLSNPAGAGFIAETTIEPIAPSDAEANGGTPGAYGSDPAVPDDEEIPDGTEVTIAAGGQSATYTYDSVNGFVIDPADSPVNVGDVTAGTQVDYTVTVNLPAGTAQLEDISIPLIAFPDDDPTASPGYTGETTNNITIDRLYTGFISLVKEARVLEADGVTEVVGFTDGVAPNPALPTAAPGQFIEYRIQYENISESAGGLNGSVELNANDFTLLEEGLTAPNNWASFTTHQQNTVATDGSVYFYTNAADATRVGGPTEADPASGTTAEKYENYVPTVAPAANGAFTFRRIVD